MQAEREEFLVLLSKNIFTATKEKPLDGFLVVKGNRICAIGPRSEAESWVKQAKRVIDVGKRVVTPGFVDNHTFFTGYVLRSIGIDFTGIHSDVEGITAIKEYRKTRPADKPVFGHCWEAEGFRYSGEDLLSKEFPDIPVVIFTFDRDTCWMNQAARDKYGFTPEECYAEKLYRMMPEYLTEEGIEQKYLDYIQMLNERGVTTIKEMGFDTYYGFTDVMERLEKNDRLNMRVAFMSQPVGEGINIAYGEAMREKFKGDFVRFEGFNRMTDRGIARFLGELIEPYASKPDTTCLVPVEWELIEKETLEADRHGFRFSLHCQGDGAVRHTVDLYEKCEKVNGRLKNRHAITDLEYTHPADLERMGRLGVIAEVYPQIQSLDKKQDIMDMIATQLGGDRGKNYWNRRKMWDSGVCVTCGTDLPLLIPDIPESIYCAVGGYFKDGESFNRQNMLTVAELLTAWTRNGQYNCYNEDRLGTLEVGKLADIAVLDADVFHTPVEKIRDVKVCLTISDGRIVHNTLR
ncbi:MAG: amidohydrolase family protein [Clostridiales bacterium]|jgi:predicted amidohydrolase YtcJ|nr:amidohydrolase family protein [Clostridiales bacterium]